MNETPERICKALEWLTGHKWADNGIKNGKPSFACADGDQTFIWDSEDGYCLHRGWLKCPSEDTLAHALAVTAPWEWKPAGPTFECLVDGVLNAEVCPALGDNWVWRVYITPDGPAITSYRATLCEDAATAKSAARAAYLTWMRGRFAMKGGSA